MLTCVNLCLPLFTRACLLMVTHVYSCLPMFTHVYLWLPLFTRACLCYNCWTMFTTVYSFLPMFNCVYLCLPMVTRVYHVYSFLFTYFVPIFTRAHHVYPCCLVFTYVYLCLPMFATVYSCLLMFTTVYSCMFPYVQHYQWIHGRVTLYFKTNVLFCVAVSRSKLSSDKRCLSLCNFSACWENTFHWKSWGRSTQNARSYWNQRIPNVSTAKRVASCTVNILSFMMSSKAMF